jgi:hypothetical protein
VDNQWVFAAPGPPRRGGLGVEQRSVLARALPLPSPAACLSCLQSYLLVSQPQVVMLMPDMFPISHQKALFHESIVTGSSSERVFSYK